MMRRLLAALRCFRLPLMLLSCAVPLMTFMLVRLAPAQTYAGCLFPALAVPLLFVCFLLPGRLRLPAAVAGFAALTALSLLLLPVGEKRTLLLVPLLTGAFMFAALPLAARGEQDMSPTLCLFGLICHLFIQFVLRAHAAVQPQLMAGFAVYVLLLLFACNSITLDNATMARHRLPASMRRFNTLLTAVFAAICVLIALLPAVGRGLARCWDGIVAAITYVVLLLNRLFAGEAAVGGSPAGMPDFVPVSGAIERPSAFAIIMEKILTAFTVVFIILGTLYLLRLALRQAIRLSRRLYAALHRYVSIASEDYEDEITDTREDDGERTHLLSRRHKRRRLPTPNNPSEAIRFRYARLLGDHPEWNDASTARDHLPGDAAHLYERARYSEHPVSQEDADAFSSGTRGL